MTIELLNGDTAVQVSDFSLEKTLECGQCFRFCRDGERWRGTALGRVIELSQRADTVVFHGILPGEFSAVWADYFDLNTDYGAVNEALCADPTLRRACEYGRGIRIMRQPLWETLCSFIISQNNNIPRIRGIIERFCRAFGQPLEGGGYDFPRPERLAECDACDLGELRCGFRDRYIIDAARKFACGGVSAEKLGALDLDGARKLLMTIKGVGPKVADCALLFGLHRTEAFPADVWIKRAMERLFPGGLPECARPYAGIAQQYIFHYARTSGLFSE